MLFRSGVQGVGGHGTQGQAEDDRGRDGDHRASSALVSARARQFYGTRSGFEVFVGHGAFSVQIPGVKHCGGERGQWAWSLRGLRGKALKYPKNAPIGLGKLAWKAHT